MCDCITPRVVLVTKPSFRSITLPHISSRLTIKPPQGWTQQKKQEKTHIFVRINTEELTHCNWSGRSTTGGEKPQDDKTCPTSISHPRNFPPLNQKRKPAPVVLVKFVNMPTKSFHISCLFPTSLTHAFPSSFVPLSNLRFLQFQIFQQCSSPISIFRLPPKLSSTLWLSCFYISKKEEKTHLPKMAPLFSES